MIQIKENILKSAEQKGNQQFLQTIIDAYLEALDGQLTAKNMDLFNGWQHSLLAWYYFSTEVNQGGFIQLIQNGYGSYIFDNPFAKAMRLFGAEELSKIVYKAKKIYDIHRDKLEHETTDEEFMTMYLEFEQFDELEEKYFDIEDQQIDAIANYVKTHLENFIEIIP